MSARMQWMAVIIVAMVVTRYAGHRSMSEAEGTGVGVETGVRRTAVVRTGDYPGGGRRLQ